MPGYLRADWQAEEAKIEFLLQTLATSGFQFERNGSRHTAKEAEAHLRQKYETAKKSWFAPPKEEWTAILFIEKVGSKSSLTGSPYFVLFPDGSRLSAESWFHQKLNNQGKFKKD